MRMDSSGIGGRSTNLSTEGRLAWADAAQRTIDGRSEGPGTLTYRMEGTVEGGKGRNLTTDSICMRGNGSTTDHIG